jgi:hypothetical protein
MDIKFIHFLSPFWGRRGRKEASRELVELIFRHLFSSHFHGSRKSTCADLARTLLELIKSSKEMSKYLLLNNNFVETISIQLLDSFEGYSQSALAATSPLLHLPPLRRRRKFSSN